MAQQPSAGPIEEVQPVVSTGDLLLRPVEALRQYLHGETGAGGHSPALPMVRCEQIW